MAWTTIPNSDVDPESPITTSLMTALRDNVTAQANGDAGAPQNMLASMAADSVDASKIIAGGVHSSELYIISATNSTNLLSVSVVLTGGNTSFLPRIRTTDGSINVYLYGFSNGNSATTISTSYVTLMGYGSGSVVAFAQMINYYVAASPPHDMGDGDIPEFIYVMIDNGTGNVNAISSAAEPVWLHNGPTNAMPDFWKTDEISGKRKKYKIEKQIPAHFSGLSGIERAIAVAELPDVEVEITNDMVHADMDLIPHPFQGNDLTGKTVVMLDPISDCVRTLADLDRAGEDVHEIIRKKYIKIGNTALNRVTPAGLLIPSTTWKKAK